MTVACLNVVIRNAQVVVYDVPHKIYKHKNQIGFNNVVIRSYQIRPLCNLQNDISLATLTSKVVVCGYAFINISMLSIINLNGSKIAIKRRSVCKTLSLKFSNINYFQSR